MYHRVQAQRKARQRKKQLLGILEGLLILLLIALVTVIIVRSLTAKRISAEEQAAADHYEGIISSQTENETPDISGLPEIQPEVLALMEQNNNDVVFFVNFRIIY